MNSDNSSAMLSKLLGLALTHGETFAIEQHQLENGATTLIIFIGIDSYIMPSVSLDSLVEAYAYLSVLLNQGYFGDER